MCGKFQTLACCLWDLNPDKGMDGLVSVGFDDIGVFNVSLVISKYVTICLVSPVNVRSHNCMTLKKYPDWPKGELRLQAKTN